MEQLVVPVQVLTINRLHHRLQSRRYINKGDVVSGGHLNRNLHNSLVCMSSIITLICAETTCAGLIISGLIGKKQNQAVI